MSPRGRGQYIWAWRIRGGVVNAKEAWPVLVTPHPPSGSGRAERSRTGTGRAHREQREKAKQNGPNRAEPNPTGLSRTGPGREQPRALGPSRAEPGAAEPVRTERRREQPKALGPSRAEAGAAEGARAEPSGGGSSRGARSGRAGHGADRVGHVGERAGAGRRAHPADGRHRGRGGAVQGLVLRRVLHRGRSPGVPARVSQEQTQKGLHHGEVWPEVPDSRGEAPGAPHQELLHPSCPPRCPGCPCWIPPLHHPGHRLPGHCQWHLPAGCSSRGGVETHRAEAPGEATSGGHHQAAPQQPPAPAPSRRPQEAAGAGGAGEPHPRGGGIMGGPPALPCSCSCFPAAPGSAAAVGLLGLPRTLGVLSCLLWVPSSW